MSIFLIYNDELLNESQVIISADNRGFRYGDGLFETMRTLNGKIILKDLHFDRLFSGMDILKFDKPAHFILSHFEEKIKELCKKNNHLDSVRVRLTVFRGNVDSSRPDHPNYVIQTWQVRGQPMANNDLIVDIFRDGRKSCDVFSNLKTNNYLLYSMAARYAVENNLGDALVLNHYERICDSSISNLFIVKDETIYTPPLSEGCVAGVTRRWILESKLPFAVAEKPIAIDDLQKADEIFLTNAISHVRSLKKFRDTILKNQITGQIRKYVLENIC